MTEVSLRELFEAELRRIEAQLAALDAAVTKSERLLNTRLEGMNEFREALKDQASQMATREQLQMTRERLEDRLGVVDAQIRDLQQQRAYVLGGAAALAAVISVLGLAIMRYFGA